MEATETTLLNFTCDGKLKDAMTGEKGEPIHNVGLVVNLIEKTVSFVGYAAPLNKVDAANIHFNGTSTGQYGMSVTVDGDIDRVTGAANATIASTAGSTTKSYTTTSIWEMLCKPTSRDIDTKPQRR